MGGRVMSEEETEIQENAVQIEKVPLPYAWFHVIFGIVICTSLFVVSSILITTYLKTRPYDLIALSEQTAQSLDLFLRDHQVSPEQVAKSDPRLFKSPKAYFNQYTYTVHLSPGVKAETMERQLSQKMIANNLEVSDIMEADTSKGLKIAFDVFELATIEFIEARASRYTSSLSPNELFNTGTVSASLTLPKLNRAAISKKQSTSTLFGDEGSLKQANLATGKSNNSSGWHPPVPPSKIVSSDTSPTDPAADDIELARINLSKKASPEYSLPPKAVNKPKAKLVIIVDDGGYGGDYTETILSLSPKLTLSILPNTPLGAKVAISGHEKGFEIMLHMPMENMDADMLNPGQINVAMNEAEIKQLTADALRQVPHAVGINNHTGSKFTTDAKAMALFINAIKDDNLFFVDSKTASDTKAYEIAKAFGIPTAKSNLFLDNPQENEEALIQEIRSRFDEIIQLALDEGEAIAICHFRPTTAKLLTELIPTLQSRGIELVHASELVQ